MKKVKELIQDIKGIGGLEDCGIGGLEDGTPNFLASKLPHLETSKLPTEGGAE